MHLIIQKVTTIKCVLHTVLTVQTVPMFVLPTLKVKGAKYGQNTQLLQTPHPHSLLYLLISFGLSFVKPNLH